MAEKKAAEYFEYAKMAMEDRDYEDAKKNLLKSLTYKVDPRAYELLEQCNAKLQAQGPRSHKNSNAREPSLDATQEGQSGQTPLSAEDEEVKENSPVRPKQKQAPMEEEKDSNDEDSKICEALLKEKDYYKILGVERTATDEELKKQYKKLALRLHPDKNHAPKAGEAFKKLSQVFACLSNKDKRQLYDEHGDEEGFRNRYREQFKDEDELDPEDLFDLLFTGRINRDRRRRGPREVPPQSRWTILLQLLPMLVMFALSMYMNFQGQQAPGFSLEKTDVYTSERVIPEFDISFYVPRTNDKRVLDYYGSPDFEQEVMRVYKRKLIKNCDNINTEIHSLMHAKKNAASEEIVTEIENEIENIDTTPCDILEQLNF